MWWRFVSGIYGLILMILGAIELGMELSDMPNIVNEVWATLSSNQKLYFDNSIDNLEAERMKNASLIGAFAIVIGFMIDLMVISLHFLYQESAVKWKPPMTSRLPDLEEHEQVDFVYLCYRDDDQPSHTSQAVQEDDEA